jgi:hypothetical protein
MIVIKERFIPVDPGFFNHGLRDDCADYTDGWFKKDIQN